MNSGSSRFGHFGDECLTPWLAYRLTSAHGSPAADLFAHELLGLRQGARRRAVDCAREDRAELRSRSPRLLTEGEWIHRNPARRPAKRHFTRSGSRRYRQRLRERAPAGPRGSYSSARRSSSCAETSRASATLSIVLSETLNSPRSIAP